MKGAHIKYTAKQLAWIKRHRKLARRELQQLFVKTFRRKDVTVGNLKALCTRKGWKTGRTGCFAPGIVPHNKGKPCPPGTGGRHRNSRKTQFKKGGRPGNTKYPGYERVDKKDGYVYLCVAEKNPYTGFEHRFVLKHKHLWEKLHGPVPASHCLKAVDGIRTNTDPANWELIPRAMLPRLSGRWGVNYDTAPAEMKPTLFAVAKLETKARSIRRGNRKTSARSVDPSKPPAINSMADMLFTTRTDLTGPLDEIRNFPEDQK